MRAFIVAALASCALAANGTALAQVKKVPYTEIKVDMAEAAPADAALDTLRKAFADAVAKKDVNALAALIAPSFLWLSQNSPHEEFDLSRDAVHNFKVAFGFREYGKDSDGPVDGGPNWDKLATFAADGRYYQDVNNLVCGPIGGSVKDDTAMENAIKKINAGEDIDWYFTLGETTATAQPGSGAAVGKVGIVALPVLSSHPKDAEGKAVTHFEVLLPSGKSGWVASTALRSFVNDSLCYVLTPKGDWKIAAFDETE